MSDNLKITSSETQTLAKASEGRLSSALLSTQALARRKMLIKSLGQGSVVVAAATVPMHSLAVIATYESTLGANDATRCGISGLMSGLHSKETPESRCTGYSPGSYKTQPAKWPTSNNTVNGVTVTKDTKFRKLFGGTNYSTLLYILINYPESEESHWITALLNAINSTVVTTAYFRFPYSASEVITFYKAGPSSPTYINALSFFKKYMETDK